MVTAPKFRIVRSADLPDYTDLPDPRDLTRRWELWGVPAEVIHRHVKAIEKQNESRKKKLAEHEKLKRQTLLEQQRWDADAERALQAEPEEEVERLLSASRQIEWMETQSIGSRKPD